MIGVKAACARAVGRLGGRVVPLVVAVLASAVCFSLGHGLRVFLESVHMTFLLHKSLELLLPLNYACS